MIIHRRFILVVVVLLMLSGLSFQRTQLIYLAYQAGMIDTERRVLMNQQHLLRTEIRQEAPLPELYHAWKERYGHLQYAGAPAEQPADAGAGRDAVPPPAKTAAPAPAKLAAPAKPAPKAAPASATKATARAERPVRQGSLAAARPVPCANKMVKTASPGRSKLVVRQ